MDFLVVLVRPLTLLALFLPAALLAYALKRRIPAGRIKAWLYEEHPMYPQTEAERRDWVEPIGWLIAVVLLGLWMWWLDPTLF